MLLIGEAIAIAIPLNEQIVMYIVQFLCQRSQFARAVNAVAEQHAKCFGHLRYILAASPHSAAADDFQCVIQEMRIDLVLQRVQLSFGLQRS